MTNSEADNFLENIRDLLKLSHISGIVNTKEKYSISQNLNRNRGLRNYVLKKSKKTPNNDRPSKIIKETKSKLSRNLNEYESSHLPPTIQTNSLSTVSSINSTRTPTISNFQKSMANVSAATPQTSVLATPQSPILTTPQTTTQQTQITTQDQSPFPTEQTLIQTPAQPPAQTEEVKKPGIFETIKNIFSPKSSSTAPDMAPAPASVVATLDQSINNTLETASPQLGGKRRKSKTKKNKKRKQ